MSSKQSIRKRGRINVVACNRCKRDKKKCDGSYLTQKPCKYCRDRNEYCEYTEPNRLRSNKIQSDDEVMVVSSNISNIVNVNGCETPSNQRQDIPLQQKLIDNDLCKSDLFLQLLTDPSTTNEQTIILKRLYNEVMKNPQDPKFNGNKRDELCMKLKLLTSSNDDHHTKIQIWEDLCSLVNEIDKIITANCEENNPSNILDSFFENFNSWNSETLGFSSTTIRTTTELQSTSPRRVESQQSNLTFSSDLTNQLDVMNPSTILNNQQTVHETVPKVRKNKKVVEVIVSEKKKTNSKKRKNRKIQKGNNKRTQPYPAGGQIVIRPTKQAHTMIWHQNDPIEDVPIMAFHLRPPTPPTPPTARPSQRSHFQRPPPPSFAHFQPMVPHIPINLWDHSTAMTMLSPKPNSSFSESEINNEETLPATNSILLSPTPSLHDDVGDIVSSPSNSSIDHARVVSDDEKDHFGLISLTQSTESPQSPSLFTMEDFIEMWSNSSTVTDDLSVVEPIWNC